MDMCLGATEPLNEKGGLFPLYVRINNSRSKLNSLLPTYLGLKPIYLWLLLTTCLPMNTATLIIDIVMDGLELDFFAPEMIHFYIRYTGMRLSVYTY